MHPFGAQLRPAANVCNTPTTAVFFCNGAFFTRSRWLTRLRRASCRKDTGLSSWTWHCGVWPRVDMRVLTTLAQRCSAKIIYS